MELNSESVIKENRLQIGNKNSVVLWHTNQKAIAEE